MIKLIVFDLDGVLVDSKEVHFDALNDAIASTIGLDYVISKEDHLAHYDGLSTNKKLKMLREKYPDIIKDAGVENRIWMGKQLATGQRLKSIPYNTQLVELFKFLRAEGYRVAVASNAIRSTVKEILMALGIYVWTDTVLSNNDVKRPKPSTEIYLKAMIDNDVDPQETLIVEDSPVGLKGAKASGAHVMAVKEPKSWTKEDLMNAINNATTPKPVIWPAPKLNVVIPMAGAGSRFEKAGYTFPKPLIEVRGKPMIQVVVENLGVDANFIFIAQKSHIEKYNLQSMMKLISPKSTVLDMDGLSQGAACTVLRAHELINNNDPLLIANSDQFLEWNPSEFFYLAENDNCDGAVITFKATHPKWSFAKVENGLITEIAEKNPISDNATVGVYYWKHGWEFVWSARQMIDQDKRVNNEFYVAPTINELINQGKRFKPYQIDKMWGLGTPEDLSTFLENYKGAV
jgi:beta-phosphoglucomutase-like phosphatase (HAD superfamily)/dTDP-glucose pyrophosphorylase